MRDGVRTVEVHGAGGQYTALVAKKGNREFLLPPAAFIGISPNYKYVAWNGNDYVFLPTLGHVNMANNLTLVAIVDDPTNWSPLHRMVEASIQIRKLMEGPSQKVSEALVRDTLAQQYDCKPEDVTWDQIRFEVSGLLPYYPKIELIPVSTADHSPIGPEEPISEVSRRAALLAEYKAATGEPSNRKIYESRNSGIYKPEFYKWVKGTLSSESATAKNFERFLREKRPPTR